MHKDLMHITSILGNANECLWEMLMNVFRVLVNNPFKKKIMEKGKKKQLIF